MYVLTWRIQRFNLANLTFQLVEIGLKLPNSASWHVIFAKLKPLENTKVSICYYTLNYTYCVVSLTSKSQNEFFNRRSTIMLIIPDYLGVHSEARREEIRSGNILGTGTQ